MQRPCPPLLVALILFFSAPLSAAAVIVAADSLIAIPTALDGGCTSLRRPIDDPRFNVMLWEKKEIKTRPIASHKFEDGSGVSYNVPMTFIEKLRRRCVGGDGRQVATGSSHRRCNATEIRQFEEEVAPCLLEQLKENREFARTMNEVFTWRFVDHVNMDDAMEQRSQMMDVFCTNKPNVSACLCF
uniref:Uncharacterized protein n=1 Tax=Oryza punctata TaxID=4537 RepID=A0A0E0LSD6_ORYPU